MWMSSFGFKPKCCMTAAWGGYCGLRFREVMLPTHSSESYYGSVLPTRACASCHSGCSGVAPLSLVVSVSGKNSPGYEEMQGRWWWWAEGLLLGMAHVFHLLGNSYGSLCNHRSLLCATTWLLCSDGGLQRDEAASTDLDRSQVERKKNQRKIHAVNCISKLWMS